MRVERIRLLGGDEQDGAAERGSVFMHLGDRLLTFPAAACNMNITDMQG